VLQRSWFRNSEAPVILALSVFSALALGLSWLAWRRSPELLAKGWKLGMGHFVEILPVLLVAMAVGGLVQVLVDRDWIEHWMGQSSGWRGVWVGCLAGTLAPGGPFITFPIAAGFLKAGAAVPTVVAFISAWAHWGLRMLLLETAFIGPRFTWVMLVSHFAVPPLAGGIALLILRR
jgi:uncharacterized protein